LALSVKKIPVIDVFAGPGGLNEGFSRAGEHSGVRFMTALSIEMESVACRTLRLRSVYRRLQGTAAAANYTSYVSGSISIEEFRSDPLVSAAFEEAEREVLELEMGPETRATSNSAISRALGDRIEQDWVLIGGPPCQAYSLAGRSRRANDETFYEDKKHFLYLEYLTILQEFSPAVFVMENVKGLLSSTHSNASMFDRIMADLTAPRGEAEYEVLSLAVAKEEPLKPSDFVLRAEDYGVPQRRHRVILVGVRKDLIGRGFKLPTLDHAKKVSVEDAIFDLPALRSGISPVKNDSVGRWRQLRQDAASRAGREVPRAELTRGTRFAARTGKSPDGEYGDWVAARQFSGVLQHEARTHMERDLERYFHIAAWAEREGSSPKLRELPKDLLPLHKNANSEKNPFEDRFRVQLRSEPSTTIVSHIAKDGHYYIHPDPGQMRSLTVREAARLQSFPDDYFFEGNRTQQYHQVGNAVPPLLARKIGDSIAEGLAHTRPAD
jgi:DNA (cytosine-5)-methyltransferase 1